MILIILKAQRIEPSSFTELRNGGKSITVKVILADGLMSNERQILLDTFSMLVLGDSIQWGQGLEPGQKIHSKVVERILDAEGRDRTLIYKEVRAHSGAVIGTDTHVQINEPPSNEDTSRMWRGGRFVFGEVPSSEPWILDQINNTFEVEPVDMALGLFCLHIYSRDDEKFSATKSLISISFGIKWRMDATFNVTSNWS